MHTILRKKFYDRDVIYNRKTEIESSNEFPLFESKWNGLYSLSTTRYLTCNEYNPKQLEMNKIRFK